jgi:hypothetical protein
MTTIWTAWWTAWNDLGLWHWAAIAAGACVVFLAWEWKHKDRG